MTSFEEALLALLIWREARGEGGDGMCAVAEVVRNRVACWTRDSDWLGIMTQPMQFSSMATIGDPETVKFPSREDDAFAMAVTIAASFAQGKPSDTTCGALYYANLQKISHGGWFDRQIVDNPRVHPILAVIGRQTFFA